MNYQSATGLRCFMFAMGAVFASSPEEADRFANEHGLWDRRPDGTWGRAASQAHARLCEDQQAAYRKRPSRLERHRAGVERCLHQRPLRRRRRRGFR